MMNASLPDDGLISWVEEAVRGTVRVVSQFAHDHDCSHLWRLQRGSPFDSGAGDDAATGGEFFWLKCHGQVGKWAGEVHALTHWTTPALGLAAPRLVAARAEPTTAVLLTEVDGVMALGAAADLGREAEMRLWRSAGEYLARLHALENDWLGAANPDGSPQGEREEDPAGFARRNIEARLELGTKQGLFDGDERELLKHGAVEWTAALEGETPRAVHRDFSPRNWMTDAAGVKGTGGRLTGVIDFEHSRWDARAADMNRWWDTDFLEKPYLAEAFFDGYQGGMPDDRLQAQILAMRLLNAASCVVWAARVGDAPFAKANHEALRRLMRKG